MGLPGELLKNADIFYYGPDSDIKAAAMDLKTKLETKSGKNVGVFYIEKAGYMLPVYRNMGYKIAWLVGHGEAYTDGISNIYTAESIYDWLKDSGYTHIVDTCCYPDTRRLKKPAGIAYYCCSDGIEVKCIYGSANIDSWWDAHGFANR